MIHQASNRWLYLTIGVFCMFFSGIIYAWSILKVPLQNEFNWDNSELAVNFTITMCSFCIGGLIGSFASKITSYKLIIIISGLLASSGFIATSYLSGRNIVFLYIFYGLMAGLGIGSAYNAILSIIGSWFPDQKGLCSGILLMGFGASTLVLGNIFDTLFALESFGWRSTYQLLGFSLGIVLISAGFILKPSNLSNHPPATPKTSSQGAVQNNCTTLEMLKHLSFWKAFISVACIAAIGNSVISFAKELSLTIGTTATLATTLVGFLSVFNGIGRILTGIIFDKFSHRFTMIFSAIFTIASVSTMICALLLHSIILCSLALCMIGISYGSCPTISSALIALFYGERHYSTNFAIMNFNLMIASSMATISGLIVSATGNYIMLFFILLLLSIISFILNFGIHQP